MMPPPFGMARMRLAARLWAGAWAVAAALAGVPTAHGDDDIVVDDRVEQPAETSGQDSEIDLGENFDRNVFGQQLGFSLSGGRGRQMKKPADRPAQDAAPPTDVKVRAALEPQFIRITGMADVSAPQVRKLRLALESDIRRAVDEIDVQRGTYQGATVKGNWMQDQRHQQLMQRWQADVQRCRDRLRQATGPESFLAKSLPSTLDAEQQARLTAAVDDRLAYLWQAIVARQMLRFDGSLGLDQRQHEALEALLVAARPALRHSFGTVDHAMQHADALVRLAILEIGSERLTKAVNGRQAQALAEFSRHAAPMRQFLEAQGVIQKKVK